MDPKKVENQEDDVFDGMVLVTIALMVAFALAMCVLGALVLCLIP